MLLTYFINNIGPLLNLLTSASKFINKGWKPGQTTIIGIDEKSIVGRVPGMP